MTRGRPRSFDLDEAIQKAMDLFWAKGYEGTTIPDLTAAIGINRPSLYSAFESKENLFRLALDRYRRDPASYVNRALAKPTALEVFSSLLYGVIELTTDPDRPGGCLFVCGSLAGNEQSSSIRTELAFRRSEGEREIAERFIRSVAEGELPADAEPARLAKLAATMMWGLSIQALNGSEAAELRRVADLAIEAFPSAKK